MEAAFIETIVNNIAAKYPAFKKELDLETFAGIGKNPGGSKGSFTYLLNANHWKKICNPSIANYDIKNVKFKTYTGDKVSVDLYISEGLIVGYKTSADVKEIDISTIDFTEIWEKHFLNKDYTEIESIISSVSKDQVKKLNMIKNTFRIEINGTTYYPIHENGDGNYFAIDKKGLVFKLTHDPFEARMLYNNVLELLENNIT